MVIIEDQVLFTTGKHTMLTKLNTHNQITLPARMLQAIAPTEYFEMAVTNGQITLTPVCLDQRTPAQPESSDLELTDETDWAKASHNFIR
jgi:hypothetical protein